MSCQGVQEESYAVFVHYPRSLASRFEKVVQILSCVSILSLAIFVTLLILAIITFSYVWIPVLMGFCHKAPGIELANLSIVNLTLHQQQQSTPDTNNASSWLVDAQLVATFATWNRNSVAKCFSTFRTLNVVVKFKNSLILQQSVPLGFSLKPKQDRAVVMDLTGEDYAMKADLGPVMENELQAGNVTMEVFFDTRYLIADRRSHWTKVGCAVVVRSPRAQATTDGADDNTLLDRECYLTKLAGDARGHVLVESVAIGNENSWETKLFRNGNKNNHRFEDSR